MTLLQEYVKTLSDPTKLSIIEDYAELERTGMIGESSIRFHTANFLKTNKIPDTNVTLWMQQLTFECYRTFANYYLQSLKQIGE